MSEKFTLGPWATKRATSPIDGEYDWCVAADIKGRTCVIGEAFGRVSETITPDAEANARLISAAPEMFEALEKASVFIDQWIALAGESAIESYVKEAESTLFLARSALAKARGETP